MIYKKSGCTLALFIVAMGLAVNGYSQSFLTNGLVAYYPFNGNANDASGNGNNGTINGTEWEYSLDRFGAPKSLFLNMSSTASLSLNGTCVTAPRSELLDFNNDFTLSVWSYLRSGTPQDFAQNFISTGYDTHNSINLRMYNKLSEEGGQDRLQFVWHSAAGALESVASYMAPVRDTWWQTIVVRSGTNVSLYKNGTLLASGVMTPIINTSQFWMGTCGGVTYALVGGIDDVRMYNRALSLSEVQQLYLKESTGVPRRATATAQVVNGFLVGITITDPGFGYTNAPAVIIQDSAGTGATVHAVVKNGVVESIQIDDAGKNYTGDVKIFIASPPFMPWLDIAISKVKVTQHVVLGKNYILESSADLNTWNPVGSQFTAEDELITLEFEVDGMGRHFRIQQVP